MNTLALKLVLTPVLIGAASLAGRRWGAAVSGSLVGLPLTSGPVVLFVALDHGLRFATATSLGILAGAASAAIYCLVYAWAALRASWPFALLASTLAYAAATLALEHVPLTPRLLFVGVLAVFILTLVLLPRPAPKQTHTPTPWWDLPARMLIATTFVVALTALAPTFGPQLSGLLAPFPLFTTIFAAFAHASGGPNDALLVLRGVVLGLFGFAAFFLVLAGLLVPVGLLFAFAVAIVAALVLQAASLHLARRAALPDAVDQQP